MNWATVIQELVNQLKGYFQMKQIPTTDNFLDFVNIFRSNIQNNSLKTVVTQN